MKPNLERMTAQERLEYAKETDSQVVKYYYEFNLHKHLFYYNGEVGGASSFKNAMLYDTHFEAANLPYRRELEEAGFVLKSSTKKEIFKKILEG